jgi:anthranilate phosphoribosyltransferase
VIAPTLRRLLDRRPLTDREARRFFDELLRPESSDLERAATLVALAARELSARELASFAAEMRRRARPFPVPAGDRPIDLCGSGGAPRPSFNVSTVSAFVVAAAGVPVVKHGNRSASGLCGSSDLLEALGLPVTTSVEFPSATYRARRLAFLHAPLFHPATQAVVSARRALGIPTVFNRLGPLSNPAAVPYQLAGAASPELARTFAEALRRLGVRRGASMASTDGCDEFSPRATTMVRTWRGARSTERRLRPEAYLEPVERRGPWTALPPREAAVEADRILRGGGGARRGSVLLTSGTALWLAGAAGSVADGVVRARTVLDAGAAAELLDELRGLAPGHGGPER